MQTFFSTTQLEDPELNDCATALRKCVHCGFCTATCPTYTLLGDELDSPRGRIMLIKSMLEEQRPAGEREVRHLDRCLSCLSCMSTCPSGVNYMHLIDRARAWVEQTYRRPLPERLLRNLLAWLLPRPWAFRSSLWLAKLGQPFSAFMPARLRAMLALAPTSLPTPGVAGTGTHGANGQRLKRVAMLAGCAQPVLAPQINDATVRLLTRLGIEVVIAPGAGCCGALTHHMGKSDAAHAAARANVDAWWREHRREPLDAIVINASGCGTTVKDYGRLLRDDPARSERATTLAAMTLDVSELLQQLEIDASSYRDDLPDLNVTYHAACSLQHGQQVRLAPKQLLKNAGFTVNEAKEAHLCCGSAGTYNLLQPELAGELKSRKLQRIAATQPDVIATGNIGCLTQIGSGTDVPVVHTVELLDWATGGPPPAGMERT